MTSRRHPEALLAAYLAEGMEILPDRVVDAILDEAHRTRQRTVSSPWRTVSMLKIALGAAVMIAVLAVGGAAWLGAFRPDGMVGGPSPRPSISPSPVPTSPSRFRERFDSPLHGLWIGYPSGWQIRPATQFWTEGELNFDSPAADVIFDPTLGDGLYLVLASQPYGRVSEDAWRDENVAWLCTGNGAAFGEEKVDGLAVFAITCGSTASAALIFTETRGYVIRLVVSSDEPRLAETYDWDWHKAMLETVDLRPEEALDALSPSQSP